MGEYNEECCGNCTYHFYKPKYESWLCIHPDSEWRSEITDDEFVCDVWQQKKEKQENGERF